MAMMDQPLTDDQRRILGMALAELMSEISEDCWAAGWMSGTEEALWQIVEGERRHWGMCDFADDSPEIQRLRGMRDVSGYWVTYDDDPTVPWEESRRLVPVDEWRREMERKA